MDIEFEIDIADLVDQIVAQFREGMNETPRAFIQQIEGFHKSQLARTHVAGFQIGEDGHQVVLAQMIGQQVRQRGFEKGVRLDYKRPVVFVSV